MADYIKRRIKNYEMEMYAVTDPNCEDDMQFQGERTC